MTSIPFLIRPIGSDDASDWCELREALWPETTAREHEREIAAMLDMRDRYAAFMAVSDTAGILGFAEASIRCDYVNGCDTSPVVFLEGVYVRSEVRRNGVAKALIQYVEQWGVEHSCEEFASDTDVSNVNVHALHQALGFEETERVIFFRKRTSIDPKNAN